MMFLWMRFYRKKREHIIEPIKRSIELYGNKPQRLALILNMAITELVLLISKVLEAARTIRNKILHTDVENDIIITSLD